MKVNKEQIQEIEKFLDKKELDYIDIRIDVIDHIAEDIGNKMKDGISFNEAFQLNKSLWKKDLELDSSYWIGKIHSAPKIVIDKLVKSHKKWLMSLSILAGLSGYFTYEIISNLYVTKLSSNYITAFSILSCCVILFQLYMYFNMYKTKTTFLYLFNRTTLFSGFLIFLNFLDERMSFVSFSIILLYTVFGFTLFSKHKKIRIQ